MLQSKIFKYIFLAAVPLFVVVGFTLIKSNTAYGDVECGTADVGCGGEEQYCSFCVGDDCPCYSVCFTCFGGTEHLTHYCDSITGEYLYTVPGGCDNIQWCTTPACPSTGCYNDDGCAPDDGCTDNYCDRSGISNPWDQGTCRSIDLCGGGGGGTPTPTPSVGPNFNVDIVQASGVVSKAQGEIATYDINIAPGNNYSGTVSLTISGCPSGATCGFSPSSIVFTNNSPNPGTSVLTVSNTGSITPAVYPFTVTGTDVTPTPDLVDSDGSDLTITQSMAAVCDNTWRDMPNQDFVDNGKLSAAQDTSGVFLYWPRRYLPWPGYSGGFIQNKCAFGGSVCVWQRSEILKNDFNGSLVYAQDPNNIFVKANQNCDTFGSCSGPFSTWKYAVGTWTDLGDIAEPWNTPTSITDKDGRSWQFQTVWVGAAIKAQYKCSSPACTSLTYRPATSGFSTNPNGPAQASLSVAPSATFYTFIDYGQQTDSIIGPSVGGSYACAWDGAWIDTAGRFRCTASASIGSYAYTTGTNNYPYPSSNICASGPTAIGALTVAIINQPPTVPTASVTEPNYCSSFGAYVNWTYSDPDGNPQSAYQVQIDEQGSFGSPEIDTGKISGSGTSYFASGGLVFNITYKARVRVWDSLDSISGWTESLSWKTPKHAYPFVDFIYTPSIDIPAKQPVQFTDQTIFYDGGGGTRVWSWLFGDGGTSSQQNQSHTYNLPGLYQSSLTATDKDNYSCSRTKPVTIQLPVPVWKEVSPK